jgi:hypothetical protein
MTEPRPLRKPWWLPLADWAKLLEMHNGAPRCRVCQSADNLSVDHIHARRYNGTDDLGNLQFLCVSHNSRKGPRPDEYWSRRFFWDQTPNLANMRTAQRLAFDTLVSEPVTSEFFSRGMQEIAGRIYLLAWVVGAGKTLGIPSVAFAFNHLVRRETGAARRADRILVLAKEQAIRDQLAADLKSDLVRYGITNEAPRVGVVVRGDQLSQDEWLDRHDIIVACAHQLWDRGGQQRFNLAERLDNFPLIFIDEPHWAADQVRGIVDAAYRSVVFGLTGSPVEQKGKLLNDFVLLSAFTYQDARDNDQSLKYISDEPAIRDLFLHEVKVRSAEVLVSGHGRHLDSTADPDYDVNQLEPATNVVKEVLRHLIACDAETTFGQPADHRLGDVVPDLLFKAHALIACNDVGLARRLCDATNKLLAANPKQYPRAAGWSAEVVHSEVEVDDNRVSGRRLTPDHPWLKSKTMFDEALMSYGIDASCARILFVVGMGREGVNNPLCSVVGATYAAETIPGVVQRHIGRQLRAPGFLADGVLHVPPARLDTIRVITHQANDATGTIIKAMEFVCRMDDHLKDLPTVAQLAEGEGTSAAARMGDESRLLLKDRLAVADFVAELAGESDWRADPALAQKIMDDAAAQFSTDDPKRAERVAEWVAELRNDPDTARGRCQLNDRMSDIRVTPTVVREDERHEPTRQELAHFIRRHHPDLAEYAGDDHPALLKSFQEHYRTWAESIALPHVASDLSIEDIRRSIARSVLADLSAYIAPESLKDARTMAHRLVGAGVRKLLDVPRGEEAANNSKYDTPQCHVVVQRHDNRRAIAGYARSELIRRGYCPRLARAFGIPVR